MTLAELKEAGASVTQLKETGASVTDLRTFGFSVQALLNPPSLPPLKFQPQPASSMAADITADGLTAINSNAQQGEMNWSCHVLAPALDAVAKASVTLRIVTPSDSGSNGIYCGITPGNHFWQRADGRQHQRGACHESWGPLHAKS